MEDILPVNIISDILLRLPVKTVISCKCVCKKWRDLVSDPYFAHLHHSRSPQCLMIYNGWTANLVDIGHAVDDYERLTLTHVKSLNLNLSTAVLANRPLVQLGSVNGLIFVCHRCTPLFIFNPVFGEYMIIPKPRISHFLSLSYGFGVSTAGEYKVIRICGEIFPQNEPEEDEGYIFDIDIVEVDVYTIGTGRWRSLGRTPLNLRRVVQHGMFLNGHVYWISEGQIYDFDLTTETFELFPSPPGDNEESKQMLGVLNGNLSRFSWSSLGFTVWVMKECCFKSGCDWLQLATTKDVTVHELWALSAYGDCI
ncbi:hypothetical protein L1987_55413 [Smallanthus sonchifolius]|uniref:Uncharacterized protein n=1 Tax=Smallanthus sonchifolius TaxID=185202 RepID=A0ACB9E9J6_9ASTR|nr:hypothetical protein L1987_55413 [Smallanthus sonchifolius]